MKDKTVSPSRLIVDKDHYLQRIDNYLFTKLKGLPKSRLYKALRKGEIRVNKKRAKPDYKLQIGDEIRLPPFHLSAEEKKSFPGIKLCEKIKKHIIYEDNELIVLNKPAGIAVHGGSGIHFGVIEILRAIRPQQKYLELIHRLDRDTSGCLLIAKKSRVLKEVHRLLVERKVKKTYRLLVAGYCQFSSRTVEVPLKKNILKSGERIVVVGDDGKPSKTHFKCIKRTDNYSLLEARPLTGRTHQIRVHAAYLGYPILGDEKYGHDKGNSLANSLGINQLCLHSLAMEFFLESSMNHFGICAILQESWRKLWNFA